MTELLTALFEGIPLWEMSLTAAWTAGAVFLLRLLLKKRAPKRVLCLLWLVVFARLLVPVKLESPVSLVPPALSEGVPVGARIARPPLPEHGADHAGDQWSPLQTQPGDAPAGPGVPAGPSDTGNNSLPVVTAPAPAEDTPASVTPEASGFPWEALLAGVWLAGTMGMLGCGLVTYLRLRRRVRFAVRVSGKVWEDDAVASPFILGLFRPRIYLPSDLEGQARQYILCHEFAHLRRFDHIVKPLCWLALALHWFNPAVWVAFLLLGRDMEGACDEAVLRSLGEDAKAGYSYTLLALADRRRVPAPCPVAFDEGDAKGRIKHVLNYRRPALWVVVVSVVAVIVAAVCLLTNPVAEKPKDTGPDSSPAPTESEPGPTGSDAPSQAPDESLNSVLDPWMLEVLRGERTFSVYYSYDGHEAQWNISQLADVLYNGYSPVESIAVEQVAILDLDSDGARELVIDPGDSYKYTTGYLILRQEGDTVRGYAPGWRSIGGLKADGTSRWSSSAANWGTGRAYFDSGEIRNEPITWCDGSFETGETNYYVEGQSATEEEFNAATEAHDALPEPVWYVFQDGELVPVDDEAWKDLVGVGCKPYIPIPVDPAVNISVPWFLDTDQQRLYQQAYSLYIHLFGADTSAIDDWPRSEELPPAEPVEVDGYTYTPSTGLFAKWEDLEAAALSVFTPGFWQARNTWLDDGGNPHQTFIYIDGRTYYLSAARGNDGTNPNFPDTFHLPEQSDTEITFVLVGHYSERRPLPGESYEERDQRYADHWEEYIGYPMRLVLTEDGWRFDEFHSAETDHALEPYASQAVPNPVLYPDRPEP